MDHGGNIREAEARFGFAPGEMLDLSTGICPRPFPIPQNLLNSAGWSSLPQYEDEEALMLAFCSSHPVPNGFSFLAAPGSQILISHLPLLGKTGPVAIPDPTYSEHAIAWSREGYEVLPYPAGKSPSPDAVSAVVVQPGNPLGEECNPDNVLALAEKASSKGGIVVVDEAFADLNPSLSLLPHTGQSGLVILRSFGKFFGLAGIRLGLAFGQSGDICRLKSMLGRWSVSSLALRVGAAALADKAFQEEQREWIKVKSKEMGAILKKHGLSVVGGTGLFTLVEDPDAGSLHDHLAKCGVWTRIFFYNEDWIRIGLADEAGLEKLDDVLKGWRERG